MFQVRIELNESNDSAALGVLAWAIDVKFREGLHIPDTE